MVALCFGVNVAYNKERVEILSSIHIMINNTNDWFKFMSNLILLDRNYVLLLCSFKEQLQQHVWVHAMEAVHATKEYCTNELDKF